MAEANKGAREPSRLVGLRTRLLLTFLIPVVLLGVGGFLLLTLPQGETALPRPLSWASPVAIFAALFALGLLLAAALGLQAGDRVSRPIAWLLRAIDAGQVRLLHQRPVQPADWEIDLLARRVQVLLKQNLSGAHAMEELEALRSEMRALLDAAGAGHLDAGAWPRTRATHLLTRRLLDFLRMREESVRDAAEGLARLQGLLEQDWREETLSVEEIAKRSERCFLEQTEMALELERLEKLTRPAIGPAAEADGAEQVFHELRLGVTRWRRELEAALDGAAQADSAQTSAAHALRRLREWDAWIEESLHLLETALTREANGNGADVRRIATRLEKIAGSASRAGQEIGTLSREAAQLQRTWTRLGERMRSLMVRIGEMNEGTVAELTDGEKQGGEKGDGAQ